MEENKEINDLQQQIDSLQIQVKQLKRKGKPEGKFSKRIVILVITLNILFTLGIMILFLKKGTEPMTLITAFFSFTTSELWVSAKIKKWKIDQTQDNQEFY